MNHFVALAARNNALWCDAVCRVNGRPGEFYDDLWLCRHGTPRFYPDAVTLDLGPRIMHVLASLVETDPSRGWAVKDSFAAMDLDPLGFETLFEAQWLFLEAPNSKNVPNDFTLIAQTPELTAWSRAWAGQEAAPDAGPFKPQLLRDPNIVIASLRHDETIVGGGILNRGAGVVGLSNLFAPADRLDELWEGIIALASQRFPGLPLVGYERGSDLAAARRNRFMPVGHLKVCFRGGDA